MTELFLAAFLSLHCCDAIWNRNWVSWERAGSKLSTVAEECLWTVIIKVRKGEEPGFALLSESLGHTLTLAACQGQSISRGEGQWQERKDAKKEGAERVLSQSMSLSWGLKHPLCPATAREEPRPCLCLSCTWPPKDVSQWLGTILHLLGPSYLHISPFC